MIHFLMPVVIAQSKHPVSIWARIWPTLVRPRRVNVADFTVRVLDLIDRVRGAEAQLSRLKTEVAKCGRK